VGDDGLRVCEQWANSAARFSGMWSGNLRYPNSNYSNQNSIAAF
jgi:hypothetical protein